MEPTEAQPTQAQPTQAGRAETQPNQTERVEGQDAASMELTEALLAQIPPPPSMSELVAAPLPADHPVPGVVRSSDDGGAWVDVLEQVGGLRLAAELVEVHPASLGDLDLVAVLAAWERVGSWVAARHSEALGALLARAPRLGGMPQAAAVLAGEVGCTQRTAQDKLAFAHALGTFPTVAEALETGSIDVTKAKAICNEVPDEALLTKMREIGLTS